MWPLFFIPAMSLTLHPMLNVAVRAARAAGAIINHAALDVEAVRVAQKQANDFVTEVDQASEAAIIETLLTAYPNHGILAEESGRMQGNPHSEHIWIIDPLDGTTNFIHGFPVYCVSIALQTAGRIEQAVVYDPTRNDLFTATRGRGAFLNDRRIRVSKRTHLADCLIATGFPYRPGDDVPTYLKMMGRLMRATAGLRRPGAAALDLAYVAAGFSDGFFEAGLKPWDVAAGALLVTEAGGLVGNFAGDALQLDLPECLAANPRIYAQMVSLLAQYSQTGQPPTPESGSPESVDSEHPASEANAVPAELPAAPVPSAKPADLPRPRLRAAPRRAPEPESESAAPRYRRAASPGPKDKTAKPAGRFGPKRDSGDSDRSAPGSRPAFNDRRGRTSSNDRPDRPAFNDRSDRPGRPAQARPPSDDRRGSRAPARPRREDGTPSGKPYTPRAPRSDR